MSNFRSFFVKLNNIDKKHFFLDDEESHHIINVLRLKIDDKIYLIDGFGTAYSAIIDHISKEKVSGKITNVFPGFGEPKCEINLAIGIIKPSRMRWVIEKSTECGVSNIFPIQMDRSNKYHSINLERYQAIIKSSVKQCARSRIPIIYKPQHLNDWISSQDNSLIIVCAQNSNNKISDVQKLLSTIYNKISLIIGPEGHFSDKEISLLESYKATFISLGKRRLRTETAAVSALSIINQLINGD